MSDVAVRTGDSAGLWRERDAELISPAYSRYSDLVVDSALGAHLHTVDGRDVLDFGCGIGVTNLGHRHPAVVKAVHEQVDRLWHTSVTSLSPPLVEAAAALVGIFHGVAHAQQQRSPHDDALQRHIPFKIHASAAGRDRRIDAGRVAVKDLLPSHDAVRDFFGGRRRVERSRHCHSERSRTPKAAAGR